MMVHLGRSWSCVATEAHICTIIVIVVVVIIVSVASLTTATAFALAARIRRRLNNSDVVRES